MSGKTIRFTPHYVQKGRGPHLDDFIFLTDQEGDTFKAELTLNSDGITILDTGDVKKFCLNVRWNVEGYGYLTMPADNGGECYTFSSSRNLEYNLNYELARTRVSRNQYRIEHFEQDGWFPSQELQSLRDLSENFLRDATKNISHDELCAEFSQKALLYALWSGEMLEMEKARWDIERNGVRKDFLFGCDSRGYHQMNPDLFLKYFTEVFNYATITHYLIGDHVNFEPSEGEKHFEERDRLLDDLRKNGITVEGRPLYWTHTWVTPDWLKQKSFSQLMTYLEKHIRTVVGHYGDRIQGWEVVNELHDWANELQLNPDQTIELTRFACDVIRDVNPSIKILVNNCSPFGEYVQKGLWHEIPAKYPQRTPFQFTKQLVEAGVDFDAVGVQVYFTAKTPMDFIRTIERYEVFGKEIQLAEVGAPSRGITQEFIEENTIDYSTQPYEWHRHWDEELQADWLEEIFTYAYSRPMIKAANWYDLIDGFAFLKSGGLLRSPEGERKAAIDRLKTLQKKWKIY